MDHNIQLLKSVISSARSGLGAVELLIKTTNDQALISSLNEQRQRYRDIERGAEKRLRQLGSSPDLYLPAERDVIASALPPGRTGEIPASTLAKLIRESSEAEAGDIEREVGSCPGADIIARELAGQLISAEHAAAGDAAGLVD